MNHLLNQTDYRLAHRHCMRTNTDEAHGRRPGGPVRITAVSNRSGPATAFRGAGPSRPRARTAAQFIVTEKTGISMLNRLLTFSIAASALMLGGCAGPGPLLTGNDTGGIIAWSPLAHRDGRIWMADHCARYGKVAAKTAEVRGYGNYISIQFRWDRRAY
jgi:hypothetical protein